MAHKAHRSVMSRPSKDTISREEAIDALTRSGYLLENRIARVLDEFGTELVMNVSVLDPETKQQRELDAYCFRGELSDRNELFSSSAHLLIECVNNPQPIAFFKSARTVNPYPIVAARPSWLGPHPIEDCIGMEDFHHSFKAPASTNYCTFVSKKNGEWMVTHADEQHQEFVSLAVLAELVRRKQLDAHGEMSRPQDGFYFCGIDMIYPILIVEGLLFQVHQDAAGVVDLIPSDHLRYCKSHILEGTRRFCPIEIVTERFLPQLLKLIAADCKSALRALEEREDEVLEAARNQDGPEEPMHRSVLGDFLP